ncbi:hypothetical protein F8388_020690, partial [Cannabis sativa]
TYKAIFQDSISSITDNGHQNPNNLMVEEYELPVIDLSHLFMETSTSRDDQYCNNNNKKNNEEVVVKEIVDAARNWGFFEVVNHGIPEQVLKCIKYEQKKVFHQPFHQKSHKNVLNLSPNSYRWGNPKATSLNQLSWSEAIHISLTDISKMDNIQHSSLRTRATGSRNSGSTPPSCDHLDIPSALDPTEPDHIADIPPLSNLTALDLVADIPSNSAPAPIDNTMTPTSTIPPSPLPDDVNTTVPIPVAISSLVQLPITKAWTQVCKPPHLKDYRPYILYFCRLAIEEFGNKAFSLAKNLAGILAGNLGVSCSYFEENCPPNSSYVRLNRYPPCPYSSNLQLFGLVPHTDSDFLSVVSQDDVGGLQLFKDERWVAVKPNPRALVINIGDLFQVYALSNGVYKSIRHRVVASSGGSERFSAAYFYCPNNDARIESCSNRQSSLYRDFTFREYKSQIQKDVQDTGDKVGLPRFLTIINKIYIS